MKSKLKWVSGVLGAVLVLSLVFGAGVYAANQDWFNFTGDKQVEKSKNNVDEILNILEEVNNGKITAEEGVARLTSEVNSLEGQVEHLENLLDGVTGENPGQKIQFLKGEVERLFNENAVLTTDLAAANKTIKTQEGTITTQLETIETQKGTIATHLETIEENKEAYDALEKIRINTQNKLDKAIAEKGELETELSESQGQNADLQALIDENNGYIQHLEAELTRANSLVKEHANYTEEALKTAKTYQE